MRSDVTANTVTGDITVSTTGISHADVDFTSLSGDLESDFDVTLRERARRQWVGARVRGTIGDGGRDWSRPCPGCRLPPS
ncbi:MAG: hypothetical protein Q8N53_07555 [Longimicrobiales bacterium]|nr:hypothetical protein [Longimicrobiales bacterium]